VDVNSAKLSHRLDFDVIVTILGYFLRVFLFLSLTLLVAFLLSIGKSSRLAYLFLKMGFPTIVSFFE